MVESIVIFLLGALGASVLALLVGPVFARRAARLAEARLRASAPLTMSEIQAQRDLLRADLAVRVRKAEIRLAQAMEKSAESRIELGRREKTLSDVSAELAERTADIERMQAEFEELHGVKADLETQLAALQEEHGEQFTALREKQDKASALREALESRIAELEEAKSTIDNQKIELAALQMQVENLRAELVEQSAAAEQRGAETDSLRVELVAARTQAENLRSERDELAAEAAERRRQVDSLEEELAASRTEIATRTVSLQAARSKLEEQSEIISRLQVERSELDERLAELRAKLEQRELELGEEIEELRALPDLEQLRESIGELAAQIVSRAASSGDDEIRKLIDAVSSDTAKPRMNGNGPLPLSERIRQADLQPGE